MHMAKTREGSEAAVKAHQERRKQVDAANADAEKRMSGMAGKPTPTQEENDLAKIGALDVDGLEPDGSGPERAHVTEVREIDRSMSAGPGQPYETRTAPSEGRVASAGGSASGGDRPTRR
jgi:hypothetical protein